MNTLDKTSIRKIILLRSADISLTCQALNCLQKEFPHATISLLVQKSVIDIFLSQNINCELIKFPYRDYNVGVPAEALNRLPIFDLALSLYKHDGNGYEEVDAFLINRIRSEYYGSVSGAMKIKYSTYSDKEKKEKLNQYMFKLYGNSDLAMQRSERFNKLHCPLTSKIYLSGNAEILIDEGGSFKMLPETICRFGYIQPDWLGVRDESKAVARIQNKGVFEINGNCNFADGVKINIFPEGKFSIGDGTYIMFDSRFFIEEFIEIGRNCAISWNVEMMDTDFHRVNLDDSEIRRSGIKIGDHSWVGAGVRIIKGVELGKNIIVAASSVVTKSFPSNAIIAGNPAKQIGTKHEKYRI